MPKYKIIRFFSPDEQRKGKENYTVRRGLSLEEAQEHCNDPKTRREGKYFDGYTEE
jgi:hypothetical protein